jgi:TetR/AcrR family transcriptional regulator
MPAPQIPPTDTQVGRQSEVGLIEQARKRLKPGERRVQILQALAAMLEQPGAERITTASLAAHLDVSEAALYRHFASKAQMYEGLIDFIEHTVFLLINQIVERKNGVGSADQAEQVITMVMHFAEKNPGLSRVMVGDALVFENIRLQQRMNLFFDKIEASLKQILQAHPAVLAGAAPTVDAQVRASLLTAFLVGRLQRFVRSSFKRRPIENLAASLFLVL